MSDFFNNGRTCDSVPVYLDYNATTPLDSTVTEEVTRSLKEDWGNPSSSHVLGEKAKTVIDRSRMAVAGMLNANAEDIIFTSGGTEANNVALLSVIDWGKTEHTKPHVITSNVEHDSVALVLQHQKNNGLIDLSFANVDEKGNLSPDTVLSLVQKSTCLVSIMHANNETGVLMPIQEIAEKLQALNSSRIENGDKTIFFHCDAAQTIGKVKVDVQNLKVDFLTIVGHKFYAPRIAALFVKGLVKGASPFRAPYHGGGQERGYRPGTENTPMIAGLGKAAELVIENLQEYTNTMKELKDLLAARLQDEIPGLEINFCTDKSLPNTLSICLPEEFNANNILNTKLKGKVLASLGAACHSNSQKPSGILLASGLSTSQAMRTIRVSVGRTTTKEEVMYAVKVVKEALCVI